MNRIRYLTIIAWLVGALATWAQGDFNPTSPAEPGQPPRKLALALAPAEGGSVSGSGRYVPGTSVTLRAYSATGFVFEAWVNAAGDVLSTVPNYSYIKGEGDEQLTARFRFSPDAPAEPEEIAQKVYYRLSVAAGEGGSVSGGGRYQPGTSVRVYAYTQTNYLFDGWYDANGQRLSTSSSFDYTTTANNVTLTARFRFNPDSPGEPAEPIVRHSITVPQTDGGYANISYTRILTGTSTTLYAYANTGYRFVGWFLNGELYTTLPSFSYTMGNENVVFEPQFRFDPDSPVEPSAATMKKFTFTLYNKVCRPGDTVKFPVYLTTTDDLYDMTFQLTFPKDMTPEVLTPDVSEKAEGYTVSLAEITDPEQIASSAVDETATVYTLSFIGGHTPLGNTVLLSFTMHVADDIATGTQYPIRINQVSMTLADGSTMTASTRNGRISVYKNGDVNGDDALNVGDIVTLMSHIVGDKTDVFIEEVANVADDNEAVNVGDIVKLMDMITESEQ